MRTRPWTMLLVMMAGWMNRQQQDMIDYLKEKNKILREKLGPKRIFLNNDQRKRLAILGKSLGRKLLSEVSTAFSPDTSFKVCHDVLVVKKNGIWEFGSTKSEE